MISAVSLRPRRRRLLVPLRPRREPSRSGPGTPWPARVAVLRKWAEQIRRKQVRPRHIQSARNRQVANGGARRSRGSDRPRPLLLRRDGAAQGLHEGSEPRVSQRGDDVRAASAGCHRRHFAVQLSDRAGGEHDGGCADHGQHRGVQALRRLRLERATAAPVDGRCRISEGRGQSRSRRR